MKDISTVKSIAEDLKQSYSQRKAIFDQSEKIYLLDSADQKAQAEKNPFIKWTTSPRPRNAVNGVCRLLSAAGPTFSVDNEINDSQSEKIGSQIETFADAAWANASMRGKRIDAELALMALLYSEIHLAVNATQDLVLLAPEADKLRAQAVAETTPLMFEVLNPQTCYPVFDRWGLAAHLSSREMKAIDAGSRYEVFSAYTSTLKATEKVTVWEYWDRDTHAVYIEEGGEPFIVENESGIIPIACAIIEGSDLFTKSGQDTRQPFTYALIKSGLWERQNLALTAMASSVFSRITPTLVAHKQNPDEPVEMDFSEPFNILTMRVGESVEELRLNTLDTAIASFAEMVNKLEEESTVYRATLGEPVGANAPFSMVSLLSQSGRQALIPYERSLSFVIGEAMNIGVKLMREGGYPLAMKAPNSKDKLTVKSADIPANLRISCNMKISVPQDEHANARTAIETTQAGIMAMSTARERYMNIGQSDDEERRIWEERYQQLQMQAAFQQYQQRAQQAAMAQQAPPAGQMPPDMMQQGAQPMPEQMPPMQPGAGDGMPLTEPMQPQAPAGQMPTEPQMPPMM